LRDDDSSDCAGTLKSTIGTFTANGKNRGKLVESDAGFDIAGPESMIGAFLKLSDVGGV